VGGLKTGGKGQGKNKESSEFISEETPRPRGNDQAEEKKENSD